MTSPTSGSPVSVPSAASTSGVTVAVADRPFELLGAREVASHDVDERRRLRRARRLGIGAGRGRRCRTARRRPHRRQPTTATAPVSSTQPLTRPRSVGARPSPCPGRLRVRTPRWQPLNSSSSSPGSNRSPGVASIVDAAVLAEHRVGHVDAVVAHALGELEQLLAHLRLLLGIEFEVAHRVLEDRLARLLRRPATRRGRRPRSSTTIIPPSPVAAELRVGHVDAVVAHALGEVEHRLLADLRARSHHRPSASVSVVVGVLRLVDAGHLGARGRRGPPPHAASRMSVHSALAASARRRRVVMPVTVAIAG